MSGGPWQPPPPSPGAAVHKKLIEELLTAHVAKSAADAMGDGLRVIAANIAQAWTLIAEETTCAADTPRDKCPRCRAMLLLDSAADRLGDWTTT